MKSLILKTRKVENCKRLLMPDFIDKRSYMLISYTGYFPEYKLPYIASLLTAVVRESYHDYTYL